MLDGIKCIERFNNVSWSSVYAVTLTHFLDPFDFDNATATVEIHK